MIGLGTIAFPCYSAQWRDDCSHSRLPLRGQRRPCQIRRTVFPFNSPADKPSSTCNLFTDSIVESLSCRKPQSISSKVVGDSLLKHGPKALVNRAAHRRCSLCVGSGGELWSTRISYHVQYRRYRKPTKAGSRRRTRGFVRNCVSQTPLKTELSNIAHTSLSPCQGRNRLPFIGSSNIEKP